MAGDSRPLPSEEVMNPSQRLRRREAAKYVRDAWGVPCAERTLAKLAVVGGGPIFQRMGRIPVYEKEELDRWVRSKLSPPVGSTTELRTTAWFKTNGWR